MSNLTKAEAPTTNWKSVILNARYADISLFRDKRGVYTLSMRVDNEHVPVTEMPICHFSNLLHEAVTEFKKLSTYSNSLIRTLPSGREDRAALYPAPTLYHQPESEEYVLRKESLTRAYRGHETVLDATFIGEPPFEKVLRMAYSLFGIPFDLEWKYIPDDDKITLFHRDLLPVSSGTDEF